MVSRADVEAAADRIVGRVRRTPVVEPGPGAFGLATRLTVKLELLQHTGSFKVRGAFNRLMTAPLPPAGVIAASGGNHGLAVAHAAGVLGVRAEVFVPDTSPAVKIDRLRRLGAEVHLVEGWYADALAASRLRQAATGALTVHAYDMPEVVAGQGTVGLEIAEDVPDVDTVVVAVGGAGLIGGVLAALPDRVRVVAVETTGTPSLHDALAAGRPVDVEVGGVAADALGARRVGDIGFAACQERAVPVVLVDDDAVLAARRLLWDELRVAAEPGGATAMAAVLDGGYRPEPGERVVVLVCGGNTDPASLA
ncbi:MAG: threonine/serine dehydratase [Actinomycetes bacterium]